MRAPPWWLWAGLGLLLLTGGTAVVLSNKWKTRGDGPKYASLFASTEQALGIPTDLLFRMGYQESRFRPDIISGALINSANAQGIMQIVPQYHPDAVPLDPAQAIPYAGQFLVDLYNQFGSWRLAVAAYNAGPGNVIKYKGIPPFTETQNYVKQIFADLVTPNNASLYA